MPKRIDWSREIVRGPLRLERPTWEPPEPPVYAPEEAAARRQRARERWLELQRLKATRKGEED